MTANTSLSYNFTSDGGGITDTFGHGTEVAGVIGAIGNNSIGIAGVNWNVTLVSLRVFWYDPSQGQWVSPMGWVNDAINYAENNHIKILNYSGGLYSDYSSGAYTINNYKGVFVCAAGNDGLDTDPGNNPHYPSSYTLPNLISVGASDQYDSKSTYSNYGLTSIDLFAPGDNIYTTVLYSPYYDYLNGTSFSAPMVTGVAALMKSINPSLTGIQIRNFILNNVDKYTDFTGKCVTGGRLNAFKAVNAVNLSFLGKSNRGSYAATTGANMFSAVKATAIQNMTVDTISLYIENPAGNVRLGLYTDNAGYPGNLLAQTGDITLGVNGWYSGSLATISPISLSSGTTYWLAFNFSYSPGGSANTIYYNSPGMLVEASYSYGNMPNTAPTPTSSFAATFSIFASGNNSITHIGLDNFGISPTSSNPTPNYFSATMVTVGKEVTVDTLNIYVQGAYGSVRLGLYTDNAGNPGNLLAQTSSMSLILGWNSGAITPTRLLAGTNYWLVFSFSNSGNTIYHLPIGIARWGAYSYAALPNSAPATPSSMAATFAFFASGSAYRVNTGLNIQGSTSDTPAANYFLATKITAGQNLTVHNLNLYVQNATGSARFGLYTDYSGNPGSLLAQTSSITLVNGWNLGEITPINLINTTSYWLVVNFSSSGNYIYYNAIGTAKWVNYTYGTFPSTAPTLTSAATRSYSFYAGN